MPSALPDLRTLKKRYQIIVNLFDALRKIHLAGLIFTDLSPNNIMVHKKQNQIVFIDDPISSLDANHVAQVSSLINTFFFRKGLDEANPDRCCNYFMQLFISTHNFEFFSFLNDANNLKKRKK